MKTHLGMCVFLLALFSAWVGIHFGNRSLPAVEAVAESSPEISDLPLGFSLVTNQFGEWRWVEKGCMDMFNYGQRGEAVASAWNFYGHQKRMNESQWKEAK